MPPSPPHVGCRELSCWTGNAPTTFVSIAECKLLLDHTEDSPNPVTLTEADLAPMGDVVSGSGGPF